MKALALALVTFFLATSPAWSQQPGKSTPPSTRATDVSVRHLLEVMQARKLVEAIPQQMDAMFTASVNKSLEGKPLSDQQKQAVEKMRSRLKDIMKETLGWNSMETIYLDVYGKTFSQSEVDSMIAFYSSPAGRAVVEKLPLVVQNTMVIVQERMQVLLPKIKQMAQETATELKAQSAAVTDKPN